MTLDPKNVESVYDESYISSEDTVISVDDNLRYQ